MKRTTLTQIGVTPISESLKLSLVFSLLIFFVPSFVHQQFLTGPIVNALLLLSLLYLGKSRALFLALIPSTAALARGLLPLPLAPMVPFIMISNCLYIVTFARLQSTTTSSNFLAVFLAALVKTLFLSLIAKFLMEGILGLTLAKKVFTMMTWPQLWTAVVGGGLALLADQFLKKKYVRE